LGVEITQTDFKTLDTFIKDKTSFTQLAKDLKIHRRKLYSLLEREDNLKISQLKNIAKQLGYKVRIILEEV
jgi:DNA-binding phage protein